MTAPTKDQVEGLLFVSIPKVGSTTRSISIEDDESVVKKLMPKDLRTKIQKAASKGQKAIEEHLVRFNRGIYFVAPPLDIRLPQLKATIQEWKASYVAIRQEIESRWDADIAPRLQEFESKYQHNANKLTKSSVLDRYNPEVTWLPFNPEALKRVLKSEREIEIMQEKFRKQAMATVQARVEVKMRELQDALGRAISQASAKNGKPRKINRKTIKAIEEGATELQLILESQDISHAATSIASLNNAVGRLRDTRNKADKAKKGDDIFTEMLKATEDTRNLANPLIQQCLDDKPQPKPEPEEEIPVKEVPQLLDEIENIF